MTAPLVWFNQGYSGLRDVVLLAQEGARGRVRLLASHADADAPVMLAADESLPEPPGLEADSPAYVDWCVGVCRDRGVRLFVPQRGRIALARARDRFADEGVILAVAADADVLETLEDKAAFAEAAGTAGLPVPWTRRVRTVEEFDAARAAFAGSGGLCVKPARGAFGHGFWRLTPGHGLLSTLVRTDRRELDPDTLRRALREAGGAEGDLVLMEHVPGAEWSVDLVCRAGAVREVVARRKGEGGQELETEGPAVELARAAVGHFGLSGLVNVQVRGPAAGELKLLEINARPSGGVFMTALCGVNLPWTFVADALGMPVRRGKPTAGVRARPVSDAVATGGGESFARRVRGHRHG